MTEIRFALIDPNGKINTHMISLWRKGVATQWCKVWDVEKNPKFNDWKHWYRKGYRIRKIRVTIELL